MKYLFQYKMYKVQNIHFTNIYIYKYIKLACKYKQNKKLNIHYTYNIEKNKTIIDLQATYNDLTKQLIH